MAYAECTQFPAVARLPAWASARNPGKCAATINFIAKADLHTDINCAEEELQALSPLQVFVPKLSGTARRRREAQLRLEQSNAWMQKRLQAIDASAGRAYSPDKARSPSARQKSCRNIDLPPAGHPQQDALGRDSSDFWTSSIAAAHGSGSFRENEVDAAADQALQLRSNGPVPGLNLAGINKSRADTVDDLKNCLEGQL